MQMIQNLMIGLSLNATSSSRMNSKDWTNSIQNLRPTVPSRIAMNLNARLKKSSSKTGYSMS